MKKLIKLNETDIKEIVRVVLEQEDDWVEVTPERYLELMKYAGYYAPGIANLPEYKGKKIIITGGLNLNGTPTKSLDGIKIIRGNLNVSDTQVSSVDGIDIKGYVSDWNSPLRRIKEKRIRDAKISDANVRREDDEWRLDTGNGRADDEAYAAHAILEHLVSDKKVEQKTDKDLSRLVELTEMLENLQEKESEYEEQGRDVTDIHADIEVTEEEIEEINNKIDIYNLIPHGKHYGIHSFEVNGYDDLEREVYCAGKYSEFEDAAKDYVDSQLEDGGYNNFNSSFVENYVDVDEVVDYFRDYYEDDIRQNPDVYFNDDDYKLSDEQESRIEEIDNEIAELEQEQQNFEVDEPEDVSRLWDEIQEKIDALESEKDDIEPEVGEPTEDMIEEKLDDMLDSVRRDPVANLKDLGIDDLSSFINRNDFIDGVVEADGIEIINSYDGSYETVYVNGEQFYVMRID
jgi:hypothetical protein